MRCLWEAHVFLIWIHVIKFCLLLKEFQGWVVGMFQKRQVLIEVNFFMRFRVIFSRLYLIHIFELIQINMINPGGSEKIQLPMSTKAVKDLHLSPCGRLALLASLGKKLSIIRFICYRACLNYFTIRTFQESSNFICLFLQHGWQQHRGDLQFTCNVVGLLALLT